MDISNQCPPGLGKPGISPTGADQDWDIPNLKIKSWISLICADHIWYIPKSAKIYLWSATRNEQFPMPSGPRPGARPIYSARTSNTQQTFPM